MKIFVLRMTWSHPRTILTLRQDGNEAETKTHGSSCWTLMVWMDLWINAMNTKEAKKTCDRLYTENMQQQQQQMLTQERIDPQDQVRQRPEQQFEGHEGDFYRVESETGWNYYLLATTTSSCSSSSWWRPSDSWWTAWNWESSLWNEQ